jgi:hypothetical protein
MGPVQYLEILAGLVVLLVVMHDLFQAVVLPRPSVYRLPLLSQLLVRQFWMLWRWVGSFRKSADKREHFLGTFGPTGLLMLLGFWSLSLMLGYALIFDGLHDQIEPHPNGFWTSLYYSAGTLLPLSYGDILPMGGAARLATIAESASGVILIALVISLLFSLYQSFQSREELVVTLDALAGAPPSGVQLLETAADDRMTRRLEAPFDVLESHLAYPILFYFRSSHDNEAWINSFGAVMDAATLVLSVTEHDSIGAARLLSKIGNHLVEDAVWYFRIPPADEVGVERKEFEEAWSRLREAGYSCRDPEPAWAEFCNLRRRYAAPLNHMAHWLAIVPARWIGDRSYLPHQASSQRRGTSG